MAVSALTTWEIQTGGSDNNGGGFVTGATGTNNAYPTSSPVALTGVTSAGAGNVCLHASAAADWVGRIANVVSGTNFTTTAGASRFEILSVVVGVSFTTGTNISGASISTGVGASGVMNVGGALKMDSASVDAIFENNVAGNEWWIKSGSYTQISSVSMSAGTAGTATAPNLIAGYLATRNDKPDFAGMPVYSAGSTGFTVSSSTAVEYINFTSTGTVGFVGGTGGSIKNCKFSNTSGSAGRPAVTIGTSGSLSYSEATSTVGYAIVQSSGIVKNCYIHDSATGIRQTAGGNSVVIITENIIDTVSEFGINVTVAPAIGGNLRMVKNTIYGAASPTGSSIGVNVPTGSTNITLENTIISGFVTGVSNAGLMGASMSQYNCMFNNTSNYSGWTSTNDVLLDPQFKDAPNGDFRVGTNMKAAGFPSAFPGGLTTAYVDIGAVQRQEPPRVLVNGSKVGR